MWADVELGRRSTSSCLVAVAMKAMLLDLLMFQSKSVGDGTLICEVASKNGKRGFLTTLHQCVRSCTNMSYLAATCSVNDLGS